MTLMEERSHVDSAVCFAVPITALCQLLLAT